MVRCVCRSVSVTDASVSGDAQVKTILVTVEYGDQGPEDFRNADVWPGVIFGKTGIADFRDISQGWLRDITQAWCWDNLNRSNSFHMFGNVLNEINYFSDYLRANAVSAGGDDIAALDRSTVVAFAAYLAALVEQGTERYRARRNREWAVPWNRSLQQKCLLAVQRILRYGRETGRMDQFAGSFMITDDLLIPRVKNPQHDDVGAALPITIIRQLFSRESMAALRALNEHMPPLVRLAAETGRRPGELVSLKYDCIDTESEGGPFLIYTETKVTAGQERKLPVLSAVVDTVREQQLRTRQHHPDTPIEHLRLFPRSTMNPHGYHPMGSSLFGETLRKWINELPSLDSDAIADDGQPHPFDRTLISGYSFRHIYAQRHADAGIAPDVLMALMGHEKISTTMSPERIPQKRRREAAEIVGNLVIDGEYVAIRPMAGKHRLADERSTIAVPFGKCSNPQNVAAEGHGCPIRHQCFGCASFSSDPSYLPEMRRRLLDLKAIRARVDAFGHKDLGVLIDEAAGGQRPDHHLRPQDRITRESVLTELATAKQRNRELQQKVQLLEHRVGARGPSTGPDLLDQHPLVIELRRRLAELELAVVEKDRTILRCRKTMRSCVKPTAHSSVNTALLTGDPPKIGKQRCDSHGRDRAQEHARPRYPPLHVDAIEAARRVELGSSRRCRAAGPTATARRRLRQGSSGLGRFPSGRGQTTAWPQHFEYPTVYGELDGGLDVVLLDARLTVFEEEPRRGPFSFKGANAFFDAWAALVGRRAPRSDTLLVDSGVIQVTHLDAFAISPRQPKLPERPPPTA
jgi:integrase